MPACFADAEKCAIDFVADHRLDEVEILLERILVDANAIGFQLLAEIVDHRVVDEEVRLDRLAPGRRLLDARVALDVETCRETTEHAAVVGIPQRAAEARGVESFDRTRDAPIGFDTAAAV